jgi:hypothetical protein
MHDPRPRAVHEVVSDNLSARPEPPNPFALHPRPDHHGFGTSLAPASERTNGSVKPRPLRTVRANEQSPDADVCSQRA